MIEIGALRLCREPLSNIYCEDINKCRPIFKAVMPRDRFRNILRFLTFDNEATRTERRKSDKLAPIRYVIETIKDHLLANYSPGKWLTIDEHLLVIEEDVHSNSFYRQSQIDMALKFLFSQIHLTTTLLISKFIQADSN